MAFVALLDANVLWPAALRCTLIRAAIHGLYRPAWTRQILDELTSSLKRDKPRLDPARVDRTIALMLERVPHALVEGYEDLIPAMRTHEKDRHVLAAAVRAGAETIVTSNVKHFPPKAREPYRIGVQRPDEFLLRLWNLSPETMTQVLVEQAAALQNPPLTVLEVVEGLGRATPNFAATVLRSGLLSSLQ
jgi:predicted nucleic acid-binding protein